MRLHRLAITGVAIIAAAGTLARQSGRVHAQSGPTTIVATSPSGLRSWDASVDRLVRDGDLERRRLDADTLVPGREHERFDQYYKGVHVYGADVTRQSDAGLTISMFGTMYPDIDLDVTPSLSVADAAGVILRETGVELGPSKMPQLLVLPDEGGYRLAYHATAFSTEGGYEYFIDARNGTIIRRLDAIRRQAAAVGKGTGVLGDLKKLSVTSSAGRFTADDRLRPPLLITFNMQESVARTIDFLNGVVSLDVADQATDSDNVWTDRAAVDAHVYAGYTYDYYFKRFGRRGLDNNNLRLISLVHPARRDSVLTQPSSIQNAFYLNAGYYGGGVMLYGEGLPADITAGGKFWNYLSGGLDVVGHELSHGVTAYTSDLLYQNESGALNEAFSDMMGTAIEFYFQPAGNGPLKADYLCGEDVVTPGGLRSLENPGAYGDPDHYSRRYVGQADNGGVHTNSGIANQAYYLAIEGGTNRTSGLVVRGVGPANRDQIEKIVYRAFTQLMPANSTFAVARAATIQAARDLYGPNSAAERAMTDAWTAVGVN